MGEVDESWALFLGKHTRCETADITLSTHHDPHVRVCTVASAKSSDCCGAVPAKKIT